MVRLFNIIIMTSYQSIQEASVYLCLIWISIKPWKPICRKYRTFWPYLGSPSVHGMSNNISYHNITLKKHINILVLLYIYCYIIYIIFLYSNIFAGLAEPADRPPGGWAVQQHGRLPHHVGQEGGQQGSPQWVILYPLQLIDKTF